MDAVRLGALDESEEEVGLHCLTAAAVEDVVDLHLGEIVVRPRAIGEEKLLGQHLLELGQVHAAAHHLVVGLLQILLGHLVVFGVDAQDHLHQLRNINFVHPKAILKPLVSFQDITCPSEFDFYYF